MRPACVTVCVSVGDCDRSPEEPEAASPAKALAQRMERFFSQEGQNDRPRHEYGIK